MGPLQLLRIVGIVFAVISLAATAIWLLSGASIPQDFGAADREAERTDKLYISVITEGKQAEADKIAARLLADGYPSEDEEQGVPDWYGHRFIIDRPFTQKEVVTVAAKLSRELPGTVIGSSSRQRASLVGDAVHGRFTFGYLAFVGFLALFAGAVRGAMWMCAVEVATAGLLALWLLLRRRQTQNVLQLGFALSCLSLYAFYLGLYSLAPVFRAYQLPPWPLRIAGDVAATELIVVGFYAFARFWAVFPRAVPKGELEAFLQARRATQLEQLGAAPAAGSTQTISDSAKLAIMLLLGLLSGLVWTGGFVLPGVWSLVVIQVVFGVFVLVVTYWQGLTCLRLFSYHRANGSEEDRRKIEWVWVSLWMGFIVLVAPLAAMALLLLGGIFIPELDGWSDYALAAEFIAMLLAPTLVFIAIAMSIQYRGSIDPKLALRGFTVWTLLSVILTLVFVFVERTVAVKLAGWWGLPPQTGFVTAGAIVAATFQPLRKRTEGYVNRFVERVLPANLLAAGVRHVKAVAVVDISGYTALSAKDEQSALIASALVQKEARRLVERDGGRVVKSTGDGVILCFDEAEKALTSVVELHRAVRTGAGALSLPEVSLHSGLHWGEVVETHDGDIYGMTINLAARIADWAKAGEIGASRSFHDQLASLTAEFQDAGPQSFKNVPEPVACLRLSVV